MLSLGPLDVATLEMMISSSFTLVMMISMYEAWVGTQTFRP